MGYTRTIAAKAVRWLLRDLEMGLTGDVDVAVCSQVLLLECGVALPIFGVLLPR
jgi:hypothetical protein